MTWRVMVSYEADEDIIKAAEWYNSHQSGLGGKFVDEVIDVFSALTENPLINARRDPRKNIHWGYPKHFPYRIIYRVNQKDQTVVVAAVFHAARDDREWRRRLK